MVFEMFSTEQCMSGLCHSCFKRHKACLCCGASKELQGNGVCKPCNRARSCQSCSEVNVALDAKLCIVCEKKRAHCRATRKRLAMWCVACFSAEQRSSGKCRECFSRACVCHHCEQIEADVSNNYKRSESKCAAVFSCCLRCRP